MIGCLTLHRLREPRMRLDGRLLEELHLADLEVRIFAADLVVEVRLRARREDLSVGLVVGTVDMVGMVVDAVTLAEQLATAWKVIITGILCCFPGTALQ